MKKQAIWLTSFLLFLIFSSNYANARIPNMLEIKSASVDLENGKIYIQGLKFGNNPIVALDKLFLEANDLDIEFIIWFSIVDYDAWQTVYGNKISRIWRDTGLYDEDLYERSALKTWQNWLSYTKK